MSREDRRIHKTRKAIIEAMLSLLAEKHYDQISVQEIVDRADVGRSTFYVHFESKDDLLAQGFEQMLGHLLTHLQIQETHQRVNFDITMLFTHAAGHYELYRTLLWGTGFAVISNQGHKALGEKLEALLQEGLSDVTQLKVPISLLATTLAGSLLIMLKWWLDEKMPYSPEEMNVYFQQMVLPGVQAVL